MNKKILIFSIVIFAIGAILLTIGMTAPIEIQGIFQTNKFTLAQDISSAQSNLFDYHNNLVTLNKAGLLVGGAEKELTMANLAISGFSFIIISLIIAIFAFVFKREKN